MSLRPRPDPPRLAVRAILVQQDHLLLVNAWPDGISALMCAPGGGVEPHSSLPDNLKREVMEETGLAIDVGSLCLVNEFNDPKHGFHQVDLFFRCAVRDGEIDPRWQDPENVVSTRRWVHKRDIQQVWVKPDSLAKVAFEDDGTVSYDRLEKIVR